MNDNLKNHFEILFNDSPNPCFITEVESHTFVFANYAMQKMMKNMDGSTEKKENSRIFCEEILKKSKSIAADREIDEFAECYVYNAQLQKHFRVTNTLMQYKQKLYRLCKFFVTSSYSNQLITFDDAMSKGIEIFSSQSNIDEMTAAFLELLGEFYDCEKTHVVFFNQTRTAVSSQFQWAQDEDILVEDILNSDLPIQKFVDWVEANAKGGILEIRSTDTNPNQTVAEYRLLEFLHMHNFTLCVIENDKKECIGTVGFSNKSEKIFDYRLLKTVTKFIQDGFSKSGMQEELKNLSETDFLTGFYSRPKYAQMLESFKRKCPEQLGVVFININGLRKTNEYMGYQKGDKQITKAASLLKEFFIEPFYRISGDEFVCFCDDSTEKLFLRKVDRLRNELKSTGDFPFSIGHVWKKGNIEVERLVAEADTVMYINKQEYYHTTHRASAEDNDSVLNDLLDCISNEEFVVYLQPQVELKSGNVIGAEALIRRFDKANNKMIFPDQFIPMYEQKSIIRHVDIFVLNKVCQMLVQWKKVGNEIPISVNLSRVTLIEFDIVNTISKICDNYKIPHDLIIIEITERVGLIENDVATSLIDEFKEQGFTVSLDDFGCAYSNIVTLANITVDEVKIDKSLVDNLLENEKNRIIVKSMIDMCNQFDDTHTLAEGIESEDQATLLRGFGCTCGQGYLYSKPIPSEEFYVEFIEKKRVFN